MAANTKLFQPISLGRLRLQHRIAMAPLTRFRADDNHVPLPSSTEYYVQRASTHGTLIIAEATQISPNHSIEGNAPGLWSKAQIDGWRKITDAVHAKGSFIYCQLFAPGRAGAKEGYPLYSSSPTPMEPGASVPQEMTEAEIWACIAEFGAAAKNAIEAGFDGIELHGANGYLIDQFTQDTCNKRTDAWGGSVENRSRFILEITKAVVEAIGGDRVGVRLSPWSTFQAMKMSGDVALEQFSHIIGGLKALRLAYLHIVESRVINNIDCEKKEGLEFAFDIWQNQSPILLAGGFTAENARQAVDKDHKDHDVLVVFGRFFISNPDLVFRIRHGIKPSQYDRSTFYTPIQSKGYIDYPFSKEYLQAANA